MKSFNDFVVEETTLKTSDGKSEVFYHGTGDGSFDKFDKQKTAYGYFFTDDRSAAEFYTYGINPKIYKVHLYATDPLRLNLIVDGEPIPKNLYEFIEYEFDGDEVAFLEWLGSADLYSRNLGRAQNDLIRTAESLGYDAVIFYDSKGGGGVAMSYVVFDKEQINIIEKVDISKPK